MKQITFLKYMTVLATAIFSFQAWSAAVIRCESVLSEEKVSASEWNQLEPGQKVDHFISVMTGLRENTGYPASFGTFRHPREIPVMDEISNLAADLIRQGHNQEFLKLTQRISFPFNRTEATVRGQTFIFGTNLADVAMLAKNEDALGVISSQLERMYWNTTRDEHAQPIHETIFGKILSPFNPELVKLILQNPELSKNRDVQKIFGQNPVPVSYKGRPYMTLASFMEMQSLAQAFHDPEKRQFMNTSALTYMLMYMAPATLHGQTGYYVGQRNYVDFSMSRNFDIELFPEKNKDFNFTLSAYRAKDELESFTVGENLISLRRHDGRQIDFFINDEGGIYQVTFSKKSLKFFRQHVTASVPQYGVKTTP